MARITSIEWVNNSGSAGQQRQIVFRSDFNFQTFNVDDVSVTGDIQSLSSGISRAVFTAQYSYLTLPSDISNGGSCRIIVSDSALDSSADWTMFWDSNGNLTSYETSQIPANITISFSRTDTVFAGENITATFDSNRDISDFIIDDVTLTDGTKGTFTRVNNRRYTLVITAPSTAPGEVTVSVPAGSVSPGNFVASNSFSHTNKIQVTADITDDPIRAGSRFKVTFNLDRDPIGIFQYTLLEFTEGITHDVENVSPDDRTWIVFFRAPATGSGQGVITVPEDILSPGNSAITVTFTYIDSIDVDISLSAAGIENSGTIIAQFDFDYDVPNFSASQVVLNNDDATLGNATAIDDDNRCWIVPVTVPQSGEGMLEISLPADAVGLPNPQRSAQVQYAPQNDPSIKLNILARDNGIILTNIGTRFEHEIEIKGNNIRTVDVQGLLTPFYHEWTPNTGNAEGILKIIADRVDTFYKELEFTVIATDADNTKSASGKITVIDVAPTFQEPATPLNIAIGHENKLFIPARNYPTEVKIRGTWIGLEASVEGNAIIISGDARGKPGVNQGNFAVSVSNAGGSSLEKLIAWKIGSPTAPSWNTRYFNPINDVFITEVNHRINLDLSSFVIGTPSPIIGKLDRFNFPDGLTLNENVLSGTTTTAIRSHVVVFVATNSIGSKQQRVLFRVYDEGTIVVPSYIGPNNLPERSISRGPTNSLSNIISIDTWFTESASDADQYATYEIVGIDDHLIYQDEYFYSNSSSALGVLRLRILVGQILVRNKYTSLSYWNANVRGKSFITQVQKTNIKGTAISPEFILRFI